jgi:ABC-type nitrate/sulfonate/bicarbonate transport system permease component
MTDSSKNPRKNMQCFLKSIFLKALLPVVALLVIWQLIAFIAGEISLIDVAVSFLDLFIEGDFDGNTLIKHTLFSLYRVAVGFSISFITAIPLGIAIGRYKLVNTILGPVIEAIRPIPPIAWIPISILMFGANLLGSQAFIIWIGAFFPILLNTTTGVKRTEVVHLDVANTFGASEQQILTKIVVPSASPEIFAGLRIGFGIGWMCLVAAEMIGGGLGLGYLVGTSQQLGRTGDTISAMLMIGLIGFIFTYFFLQIEKRLLHWRKEISI